MNRIRVTLIIVAGLLAPTTIRAQVAGTTTGTTTLGVAVADMQTIVLGWSAKHHIMGKTLYNEKNETVGTIDDIIITPDKAVSYAIVGAGGFIGLAKHDVAIPITQIKAQGGKFVLAGATKDVIKALPKFEYTKKK